ncbi:hypothetical protein HDV06_003850 [Boothiomyces sp. JEL0866]|nr:hypothetical protein HDV06_003850 [Boothiomyces sp. JEL0866]
MDHLRQFEHPIAVYMSRTAVIYSEEIGEHKWIAHCKDREECTDTSALHLEMYWHTGNDCLDPNEALIRYAGEMKDQKFQTEQEPVLMNELQLPADQNGFTSCIKSLRDISLEKVAEAINENPFDFVQYFQSISEEIGKSYFKLLTYFALEKLVEAKAFDWLKDEKSYHDYHHNLENRYRTLFASDRTNNELKDTRLMMSGVFIGYQTKNFECKDTDTLLLQTPYVQKNAFASKELFKKQWFHITGGIFENMDLSNLFFAGGAVLAALQPFDPSKDINEQLLDNGYYNSDIDIFVYGIEDVVEATKRIQEFCKEIQSYLGDNVLFVRNRYSLTIVREYPLRQIQAIFRLYKSPAEVLMGFDIDCCSVGFDGHEVYGIPRFFEAVTYQRNTVDISRRSPSYEYRLYKYSKRGFGVLIKDKNVDVNYEEKLDEHDLHGLPRLLALSRGSATELYPRYQSGDSPHSNSSESSTNDGVQLQLKISKLKDRYLNSEEYIKFVRGEPYHISNKRHKGGLLPDSRVTELIDIDRYVESNSFKYSNYMTVKIPYSANWDLERIENFVENINHKFVMNETYGLFNGLEFASTLQGEDEDHLDIPDCIEVARSANNVLQANLSYIEDKNGTELISQYSPVECWLIDNPGQQLLTGSFRPILSDFENWISGEPLTH